MTMEWQPIETAPKDKVHGIRILVCRPGCASVTVDSVHWSATAKEWQYPYLATHWMPLPDPLPAANREV